MKPNRARNECIQSSFRDPSGVVYRRDELLLRQVNHLYREHYDHLIDSGLYETLVNYGLLIPHIEVDRVLATTDEAYKVLQPKTIPFISYPYEWCFSQLKDAALTTLEIQNVALEKGMILKDASAYNVQFRHGRPVLIDTLSFEIYRERAPWIAYGQFCQHFLAPLALMSYRDIRLGRLLRVYLDGVPLDLASLLLPTRAFARFSLFIHIYLHGKSQKRFAGRRVSTEKQGVSRVGMLGLIESLETAVRKLAWRPEGTAWGDYYSNGMHSYSGSALEDKKAIVSDYLAKLQPKTIWDLGANQGLFSRIASELGIPTIAFDIDPAAVELNYLDCVNRGETRILPLALDLTNPSPAIGWENEERMSFMDRAPTDTVVALALVHHLAIANNLPLGKIAEFFQRICRSLVIEFVPKTDPQVDILLASRSDIFNEYTPENFEREFGKFFEVQAVDAVGNSGRTLYLMRKK